MANLAGLHDIQSVAIAPPDTWVLDTVALSENPQPKNYPGNLHVVTRLNWGYGSTGTIPPRHEWNDFLQRLKGYVSGSRGCTRWVVGNEPNLRREWPAGEPITPWNYAKFYVMCRGAIHALSGHKHDEVLIAASGPWNDELKYEGNPAGDWIKYFEDVIEATGHQMDGFSIHSYTHGYNVSLVTSSARMQAPFQHRHYEFRAYRDYLEAIPDEFNHLPVYLTEANGNGPWQAVGLMPAMLGEIAAWNKYSKQKVHCVVFYRYPKYDDFYIEGRGDVIAEYHTAVARGYQSPQGGDAVFIPSAGAGRPPDVPALPVREFDPQAQDRGVTVETPELQPGTKFWFAQHIEWLDEQESQGRVHIYGNVYEDGQNKAGVPLLVRWPGKRAPIKTEDKSRDTPPFDYWYNFPMTSSLNEFSIEVNDGTPSEVVKGIGMGANGNPSIHTSTVVNWVLSTMPALKPSPPQPVPTPPGPLPVPSTPSGSILTMPCAGVITQRWGENPEDYEKFGIPGHNGLDIANNAGTPINAIADGVVTFAGVDRDYGNYVRVNHPHLGISSFYAHLQISQVGLNQIVKQNQQIALMGSTGNSTGNHLHLELRLIDGNGNYIPLSGGYGKGRIDPEIAYHLLNLRTQG